jgi:hypothetical protein
MEREEDGAKRALYTRSSRRPDLGSRKRPLSPSRVPSRPFLPTGILDRCIATSRGLQRLRTLLSVRRNKLSCSSEDRHGMLGKQVTHLRE